jgi:multicomponent Na+:H+ antiporter subunit B
MRNVAGLLFSGGLAFLLLVLLAQLPFGHPAMLLANEVIQNAPNDVATANLVASVLLAYRGIDTLGELAILFTAAAGVGLLLGNKKTAVKEIVMEKDSGFITTRAIDLIMPLLMIVGFYIIFYGHLTPGGGFQGGVILAIAFFLPVLVRPGKKLEHGMITIIEGLAGGGFILLGLLAMFYDKPFLQPFMNTFLGNGDIGSLWSAGSLPLLYLAVGLKVGAELAGLLITLAEVPVETPDEVINDKDIHS